VSEVLPAMLAASVEHHFFDSAEQPWSDQLRELGEPSPRERLSIFETTLRQVILPGFTELAVETTGAIAWLDERLGPIKR
jgi:hypothetical protein